MQASEGISNSRGVSTCSDTVQGLVQSTRFPLIISQPGACKLMQTDGMHVKLDFCYKIKNRNTERD